MSEYRIVDCGESFPGQKRIIGPHMDCDFNDAAMNTSMETLRGWILEELERAYEAGATGMTIENSRADH